MKYSKVLEFLVKSVVPTKYGNAFLISITDVNGKAEFMVKILNDVPMFLNGDEVFLNETHYKKAGALQQKSNMEATLHRTMQEVSEKRKLLDVAQQELDVVSQKATAIKNSILKLETLDTNPVGSCYNHPYNKRVMYKVLGRTKKSFRVVEISQNQIKSPVMRNTIYDIEIIVASKIALPEAFDLFKAEVVKSFGL